MAAPEPISLALETDVHSKLGTPGVVLAVGLAEVGAQVEALETAEVLEVRHVEHVRLDAQPDSARDGEVFREPQIQTLVGPEPEDVPGAVRIAFVPANGGRFVREVEDGEGHARAERQERREPDVPG